MERLGDVLADLVEGAVAAGTGGGLGLECPLDRNRHIYPT
jgi:hypothetical protein